MKQPKALINFYVPENLKTTFDSICHNYGYSRTAALLSLMNKFINEKAPEIANAEKQMESINHQLSNTRILAHYDAVREGGNHPISLINPEDDGCSDADGRHEGVCATVVSGVDAPPVFDFTEHVFDLVSLAIEVAVMRDRDIAVRF